MKEIKFRKIRHKASIRYKGRKEGFIFEIIFTNVPWGSAYALVEHSKKDIRFNTLWSGITFNTITDAFEWCNNFKSKEYQCIGEDVVKN